MIPAKRLIVFIVLILMVNDLTGWVSLTVSNKKSLVQKFSSQPFSVKSISTFHFFDADRFVAEMKRNFIKLKQFQFH